MESSSQEASGTDTSEVPDPSRLLCWWPDPDAWNVAKRVAKNIVLTTNTNGIDINFFTITEWVTRPDITEELAEYFTKISTEIEIEPEECEELFAEIQIDCYAQYLHRLRTLLLYFEHKSIPTRVVLGNNKAAVAYFTQNNLSPHEPTSWASVSRVFEKMPDFVFEHTNLSAPLYVINPTTTLAAAVYFINHLDDSPLADAIGVLIYTTKKEVTNLVAWINPSGGVKAYNAAFDTRKTRFVWYYGYFDGRRLFSSGDYAGYRRVAW